MRGFRGATTVSSDSPEAIQESVVELLHEIMVKNDLDQSALVSVLLTATPDIHSAFPAAAARKVLQADIPLMCAVEMDVEGALPLTLRVLIHAESELSRAKISHIYLRGAQVLRPDLAN